ncbi:MAG: hypothetical protein AAGI30_10650 [Planctomycetota bacterium]
MRTVTPRERAATPRRRVLALTSPVLALTVAGPVAGVLWSAMRGADGGHAATAIVGRVGGFETLRNPLLGALSILLAVLVALPAARLGRPMVARLSAGLVLAWAALVSGRLDELIRSDATAIAPRLILEGAIASLAAFLWFRAAPPHRVRSGGWPALALNALGVASGLVVAHIVATSALPGQGFAAASIGALSCGVVLRVTGRSALAVAWMPLLGSVVGWAHVSVMLGPGSSAALGSPAGLVAVMPIDWLAGALVGGSLAWWWVSTVESEPVVSPALAARPTVNAEA